MLKKPGVETDVHQDSCNIINHNLKRGWTKCSYLRLTLKIIEPKPCLEYYLHIVQNTCVYSRYKTSEKFYRDQKLKILKSLLLKSKNLFKIKQIGQNCFRFMLVCRQLISCIFYSEIVVKIHKTFHPIRKILVDRKKCSHFMSHELKSELK